MTNANCNRKGARCVPEQTRAFRFNSPHPGAVAARARLFQSMNRFTLLSVALLAGGALAGCSNSAETPATAVAQAAEPTPKMGAPVTVDVAAGERQTFGGLGASVGNWSGTYQKMTPAQRTQMSKLLWHDLKFNTLRLWFNTDQYAATPGAHDMTEFARQYLDSGLIADARKQGVTTLLLAPEHLPDYMKGPTKDGGTPLLEAQSEQLRRDARRIYRALERAGRFD